MKFNLHTHTYRCHHAFGTDEEYVQAAIAAGFDVLGFSDHTPFPYTDGYVNGVKMLPEELPGYLSSVQALKEKYKDQLTVLTGLECEAVPRFYPYLRDIRPQLDYMLLGSHGDCTQNGLYYGHSKEKKLLYQYLEETVAGMETGLFCCLAHPDLVLRDYPEFDSHAAYVSRELCQAANRLRIPLEYNLNGITAHARTESLGYPCHAFWQIAAEENVRAVIGVDAHRPEQLRSPHWDSSLAYLRRLGISVAETLDFL